MSELGKLWEKHKKAIKELQENCVHVPNEYATSINVDDGVWGEGICCSLCGKVLKWTEKPERKYELVEIPS